MVIGYNPCGAIVEWGRHRYDTDCRFFRDSDVTVPIRWYPALPDAVCITTPVAITQRIWDDDNYSQPVVDGVGEVWGAKHTTSHMRAIPGADGSHLCGTASDFEDGAIYDPLAHYDYRPDGLPVCCPGAVPLGVVWGSPGPLPLGVVWSGQTPEGVVFTTDSCATPGAAHLVTSGFPAAVKLSPPLAAHTSMWVVAVDASVPTAPTRIRYVGFQVGTVFVLSMVFPSFCIVDAVLYSGPADVPFELDVLQSPTRQITIAVTTAPTPFGAAVITLTSPPPPP